MDADEGNGSALEGAFFFFFLFKLFEFFHSLNLFSWPPPVKLGIFGGGGGWSKSSLKLGLRTSGF